MSLRYILLLHRDVPKAASFFTEALGLKVSVMTEKWAELRSGDTTIALKAADSEAYCSKGYSPILVFNVQDLQHSLTKMLSLGAVMDGAVQYGADGSKVGSLFLLFLLKCPLSWDTV